VNWRDAVVHADHNARKIRAGKNRNGNREGEISADQRKADNQKEDRSRKASKPHSIGTRRVLFWQASGKLGHAALILVLCRFAARLLVRWRFYFDLSLVGQRVSTRSNHRISFFEPICNLSEFRVAYANLNSLHLRSIVGACNRNVVFA